MNYTIETTEISERISEIFNGSENLTTAFIAGSIASNSERPDSDIDIFVCHSDVITEEKRAAFTDYYHELHTCTGRTPDFDFPGEVMHVDRLKSSLGALATITPHKTITDMEVYDGIVWAGMLVGEKRMLMHTTLEHDMLVADATSIVVRWVHDLCDPSSSIALLPPDKILKRITEYNEQLPELL